MTEIDGDLIIEGNGGLLDLIGLNALRRVYYSVSVVNNDALASLQGLESLRAVGGKLEISENAALCEDDVDALVDQLTSFGGRVRNTDNLGTCPSS